VEYDFDEPMEFIMKREENPGNLCSVIAIEKYIVVFLVHCTLFISHMHSFDSCV